MKRISTGNPQLDLILCGGLPHNSINVVMGAPGSGKTIFAEQLVFANAGPDCRVLYITTLSEPLPKMVTYLQTYAFVDIARIGSDVVYHSLSEELMADAQQLHDEVLALIKQHRPRIIVIDSFKAIADLLPNTQAWRKMVFDLAGLLTAYGATSLWIGEYTWETGSGPIEFAIADGIIELQRVQRGARDERYIRVAKLRGSGFRDGSHAFWIADDGLHVFPRLVTPSVSPEYEPVLERVQTGIVGLDAMIENGWLRGTSTLLQGPSGSGKTMVALHFLRQAVEEGEPALLVNFQENPEQLRRSMNSLGWNTDELLGPTKLDHFYISPVELQIDTIVQEIFRRLTERRVQRLVIDAVGDLRKSAYDPTRFDDYLYSMLQHFAISNVTVMLTVETPRSSPEQPPLEGGVSYMSDNIVALTVELGTELYRWVRILKTRGSAHDGRKRVLHIGPRGIIVE
ncbi:MAG TPA: ATPase domain-containing protein [Enhygromyxa sp.]|nr:ATPase domain-containing protein [Enhygromyxa sp.]